MSQPSAVIKTPTRSLQEVRSENDRLQRHLIDQKSVIDSLERRAGRSFGVVENHLTQLVAALQDQSSFDQHLHLIQHEVNSLCDLLSDAMLLQKLEAGKVDVRLVAIDLHYLINSVSRHLLEPRCNDAVRLVCQIEADLPTVLADQDLTESVVTDLLARTLKYSDPSSSVVLEVGQQHGFVELRLHAQRFAPPGDRDFATEIVLCCRQVEVQNGQITCQTKADGTKTVVILLPIASPC
jgi:signal transduction histidine kinase